MPDRVQRATYSLNDPSLLGFGSPVSLVGTELKLDNRRDDVIVVKRYLKQLKYYTTTNMTDVYTPALMRAVKRFQRDQQITPQSGEMDMKTRMALEAMVKAEAE